MPRIPESGAGLSLSLRLALSLSALILLLGLLALLAIGRMTERLQQAVGESAGAEETNAQVAAIAARAIEQSLNR